MKWIQRAAAGAAVSTLGTTSAWAADLDPTATSGGSEGIWVLLGLLAIAIVRSGGRSGARTHRGASLDQTLFQ